jgi:osmotically-inducible protein OsmY
MADYRWSNDERRRWDMERDRFREDRDNSGRPDWRDEEHFLADRFGENWNRWPRDDWRSGAREPGRGGDYGRGFDMNRHSGMYARDYDQGTWDRARSSGNTANRGNFADYRGNYGSYPSDYEDFGDWQGQGSRLGAYGGPRFGSNAYRDPDMYGRGYADYDRWNRRGGYSTYGRDYAGSPEGERSFWDKAGDEIASWVGDDAAARRREMDRRRSYAGRGPKGYTRSDDRIREDVNDCLTDDWRLDATNIDVRVANGEVTLDGSVASRDDKHRAEHLVENLSGVRHVQNNLRIDDSWRKTDDSNPALSTPVGSSGAHTSAAGGQSRQGAAPPPSSTSPGANAGTSH